MTPKTFSIYNERLKYIVAQSSARSICLLSIASGITGSYYVQYTKDLTGPISMEDMVFAQRTYSATSGDSIDIYFCGSSVASNGNL